MTRIVFSLVFYLPMVLGQYGGYGGPQGSSTPTATSAASGSTQTVTVGENGAIAYNPDTIVAAPGTSIEFHFFSPVHSVAQSSFSNPCEPINNTAFFSGPMAVTSGEGTNVFTLAINDTTPLWFYCTTPTHCQGGMNGVINPPSDGSKTLAEYKAAAAKTNGTVSPAQVQGGTVGALTTSTAASTPTKAAAIKNEVGVVGFFGLLIALGLLA